MEQNSKIVLFQETKIRRQLVDDVWFFNVVDVIETLTDSPEPRKYWSRLKKKMTNVEGIFEMSPIWRQLKFEGSDGKNYQMDASDTEGLLRIIMSISSPKAEPFKQWLAKVGQERIEEIENPELGIERVRDLYKSKGYPDAWIDMRIQSIEVRKQLTDEWKGRDVKEGKEYSILTAEIAKATFGLTPTEHKNVKGLERQNLRDHMTTLELIFSQLGEEMTRKLAIEQDAVGFNENAQAARQGGRAAGKARLAAEEETGVQVVSADNFLNQIEKANQKPLNEGNIQN